MARVLFAMFEGGGKISLITPVVAAVVDRGHEVTVVAGPNIPRPNPGLPSDRFHDRLRTTGAEVMLLCDRPIDPLDGFVLGSALFGRTPSTLFGAVDSGRTATVRRDTGCRRPSCRRAPRARGVGWRPVTLAGGVVR